MAGTDGLMTGYLLTCMRLKASFWPRLREIIALWEEEDLLAR